MAKLTLARKIASIVLRLWKKGELWDPAHSVGEERWVILGLSNRGNLLVVAHKARGEYIRIISAWRANAKQRKQYEKNNR